MKKIAQMLMVAAALLVSSHVVRADAGKPTAEDAKALALKAADFVATKGVDEARKAFDQKGEFYSGELYAGVMDFAGNWVIYPPKPAAEGSNIMNVRDSDGKYISRAIVSMATDKGEGWVEYRWLNPAANQIQPKLTYVKRVPGKELLTYVGIYKN